MNKIKGFSLIELLVGLIIVSLLISAFMPLITKKMKANSITVGSFGNNVSNVGPAQDTPFNCPNDYHGYNGLCYPDLENCLTYEGANCTSCIKDYHVEEGKCVIDCDCENGICEEGKHYCTSCDDNFHIYENKCYINNVENCAKYLDETNCKTCDDEYTLTSKNECKKEYPEPTNATCTEIGAIFISKTQSGNKYGRNVCVTKRNVGDANSAPIASEYQKYKIAAGKSCAISGNCCWTGTTTTECDNKTGYSGCTRTICQYKVAKASCNSWATNGKEAGYWRLPTMSEFEAWNNNASILQKNVLDLCCNNSDTQIATQCSTGTVCVDSIYGSHNYCWNAVVYALDGYIHIYRSATSTHPNKYQVSLSTTNVANNEPGSARCVYDGKYYE